MIYIRLVEKKLIQGRKALFPSFGGGVIRVKLLPPIDKVPDEHVGILNLFAAYVVNQDDEFHELPLDQDEPLEMQPVLEGDITSYRSFLIHTVNVGEERKENVLMDFGVIDVPCDVFQEYQTEKA